MVRKTTFNKKFGKKDRYMPGEYDIREREDAGIPTKEPQSADSSLLNQAAFKDLALAQPITVQANPTAEATRSGVPYAIVNRTNQVWEAEYPGSNNMAGNTIPLLNNSVTSTLLNEFDCGQVNLIIKYLYAAIQQTDVNQALNVQLGKSMEEALSKAYSESYINMPFFKDLTITSSTMSNCDAGCRTQALVWYQTMLQNIAAIPGKYNLLVSLEQHLKDMCYNRNVAPLDDLFGLLKKNSFRSKIIAFSNIITGEYFDLTWFKQVNTLTMVPSRKSNSMRHPLLVIDATHDIPELQITRNTTGDVVDSANYDTITVGGNTVTFREAIAHAIDLLSPYNVIAWARQFTEGIVSTTPTQYFNNIVTIIEDIRNVLSRFPSDVAEIRAVLDVANRVGLNRWKRGVFFDVTREMNYQPVFNKLCNDVFVNYLASPNTIYYDSVTLRWRYYSLWNEFLGIPKYDKFNGGSFLTFSTRQFENSVTPSTDTKYLIPKLFEIPGTGNIVFVNRKGITADIGYTVYNSSAVANSPIYARLNSLAYSDYDQRVPVIDISSGYTGVELIGSALFRLMSNLFNLGNVKISNSVTNEALDSDIVTIIDVELDDVSNAMIAFAQAYAPFKVYAPVKERTVGFKESASPMK